MVRASLILGLTMSAFGAMAMLDGCNTVGGACAVTVPASCPTTVPSYAADVAPVLQTYCVSCHMAGGQESNRPLDTYAQAAALSSDMQGVVASCEMPPSGSTQLSAEQLQTLLSWIECGAPNN